ncbi:MAG TPA: hypothetical protein VGE74_25440 [Gemmata sp.]
MLRPLAGVVLVALFAVTAAAEDAVEIKLAAPKAGARYKVIKTEKTVVSEEYEIGGKKTGKDREETRRIEYTEEVLVPGAAGGEKPMRAVRVYEKYETKGGKGNVVAPLRVPITITKRDGKYAFTSEKPLGDFAQKLDEEFNKPDEPTTKDFLPGKAVKPGDSWKVDTAKFVKSLGAGKMTVDGTKAAMTGKLLKAYKKDGKQFGVIELVAEFPLKDLGKDGPPLKRGAIKMTTTADVCIDGTDPAENTKGLLGFDVVVDAQGITVSVKSEGVLTTTKELLPAK